MRILHITETISGASGVATFVREIDAELKARGVESRVCCCRDVLTSVARSAKDESDIIHIHGLWLGLYHRAAQWAYAHGIPVVWSTHGMTAPWCLQHKRWKKRLAWWLYQGCDLRRASAIHCTSEQEVAWNAALGCLPFLTIIEGMRFPTLLSKSIWPPVVAKLLFFLACSPWPNYHMIELKEIEWKCMHMPTKSLQFPVLQVSQAPLSMGVSR